MSFVATLMQMMTDPKIVIDFVLDAHFAFFGE